MRLCPAPKCPAMVERAGYCREHQRGRERARGSAAARGYGPDHVRRRREAEPLVAAGRVRCWRCGKLIMPGQAWDLGHDDADRSIYRGPEHERCNRSAAGRSAHH